MTRPPARLWFGRTTHTRMKPFQRSFTYRVAMLEIDIDRLDEASRLSHLFSVEQANVISFRPTDHGARVTGVPLRLWAEGRYAEAGIGLDGGAVRLVTFPRVLGYGFAPISLWFGYGPDGECRGVIYEVHNTFGETHSYVSAFYPADQRAMGDKDFHVSPFWSVDGQYRFTLRHRGDALALIVENLGVDGAMHVASLSARAQAMTSPAIGRWLATMPFSGIGVMIAIYWQALRLWLKGAQYHAKPEQRARRTTLARPTKSSADAQDDLRKRA
ncbi:MAG TPA: DUF1365 domain-containing protein [Hyphomonadaceae bacterium]|nr:DUF1365 domain-containing protein [Hyphomonadaceae bacterium]